MSSLEQLRPTLKHQNARGTTIADVRIDAREDSSGEPAYFLTLVLSDPPQGAETWPVEDLWELKRRTGEAMSRIADIDRPWFVTFEPEHPEPPDPDELSVEVSDSAATSESVDVAIEPPEE